MHPRLPRPLPCQDHLQGRPALASHSRTMPLQLLRQLPRDCLPRQEAARHKAIASQRLLQHLLRSSSMKASRSRPSGLLKQSPLDSLHRSARPLLQPHTALCTATAQQQHSNGDSSTYSTSGMQTAATPAPAHDPVAAARAVAARLAGQMGQSVASYSNSAASAAPGQSGQSAAQDPIAAAQAVAARLAARHGDTSTGRASQQPIWRLQQRCGGALHAQALCLLHRCCCCVRLCKSNKS